MKEKLKEKECVQCRDSHGKYTKAIWFCRGEYDAESLCDKCYKDAVKWYAGFKKVGVEIVTECMISHAISGEKHLDDCECQKKGDAYEK